MFPIKKGQKGLILDRACCSERSCRHTPGTPIGPETVVGIASCGRCLFHVGCVSPETKCIECHIPVGKLDTARLESCLSSTCRSKTAGLCASCTKRLVSSVESRLAVHHSLTQSRLESTIKQYPGFSNLPPILIRIVSDKVVASLVTSWKYSISGNTMCVRVPSIPSTTHFSPGVLILLPFFFLFYPPFFHPFLSLFYSRNSFVAVILRAHEKTPVPMTWSELVHLGGFGHVASEAITELRRSIEGTQRLWKKSRDGRLVLVNTPVSHTDSPAGLFGFLEGKGVETSAASSIAGLYPDACLHLHSLLREGRVHLASGRVFVGPPNPPGDNSLEDYRDRISKWREISSLN